MNKKMELEIGTDGVIRTIYSDDLPAFAEAMGAEIRTVCRASNVEWEEVWTTKFNPDDPMNPTGLIKKGWTVRAVHDPDLALRWKKHETEGLSFSVDIIASKEGELVVFGSREEAIKEEVKSFFQLLPPKENR